MVKIRLTRGGAKKRAYFKVIAIDERARRDGRALEYLGTYDPISNPPRITLEQERIDHWVGQGAQLTPAVKGLVKRLRKQTAAAAAEA